jgi:Zn-dependent protease with chaperone function
MSARAHRPYSTLVGRIAAALWLALTLAPPALAAAQSGDLGPSLLAMRALDARVTTVGFRLATASRELCARRQWLTGLAVHDASAYIGDFRAAAVRVFGFGAEPRVLAVVPGSPAERAGVRVDDVLLRVDGQALAATPSDSGGDRTEAIQDAIDAAFADGSAELELRRGETALTVRVAAEEGCASRFQLLPARGLDAHADGEYVQITTRLAEYVADDQELAAVLAHEFAHNVLGHRERLDAARVARGFLGNFGRNARLIRETEVEADRLSVYLLDRAGFDPEAAVRFWRRFRGRGLNFLGSSTHGSPGSRIALFRTEIEAIRRARAAGTVPTPPLPLPARPAAGPSR